jgi:hypothetical protein
MAGHVAAPSSSLSVPYKECPNPLLAPAAVSTQAARPSSLVSHPSELAEDVCCGRSSPTVFLVPESHREEPQPPATRQCQAEPPSQSRRPAVTRSPCATPDVEDRRPAGSLQRHPLSQQAESTTGTTMPSRAFAARRCQYHLVAGTSSLEDPELPAAISSVHRALARARHRRPRQAPTRSSGPVTIFPPGRCTTGMSHRLPSKLRSISSRHQNPVASFDSKLGEHILL